MTFYFTRKSFSISKFYFFHDFFTLLAKHARALLRLSLVADVPFGCGSLRAWQGVAHLHGILHRADIAIDKRGVPIDTRQLQP